MSLIEDHIVSRLINVHQVEGPLSVLTFLRGAERSFVEGLFYVAKRGKIAHFEFENTIYELKRRSDMVFVVEASKSQDYTVEQFG